MKYILELVLSTVIIFFVWNMLRRIFLTPYQGKPQQRTTNPRPESKTGTKPSKQGLNWDAEDAEFEEVKNEEKVKL